MWYESIPPCELIASVLIMSHKQDMNRIYYYISLVIIISYILMWKAPVLCILLYQNNAFRFLLN